MIAHDGLASFLCESRVARSLTSLAITMDTLASYFILTEVGVERCTIWNHTIIPQLTFRLILPCTQLLLDCNSWLQWRIPHFNSFSYKVAATLTSAISALTAVYFIGSAVRAQRYLSTDNAQKGGTSAANVANTAAMRRLMRRVLTSGCLMLVITVVLAIGTTFMFSPVGFVVLMIILYPLIMVNSSLQIDSFAPASGAPSGPLRDTAQALRTAAKHLWERAQGITEEQRPGIKRLRFLIGEGPAPLLQANIAGDRGRSLSIVVPLQRAAPQTTGASISVQPATGLSSFAAVVPEPEEATRLPWASRPVSQREGVSYSFLLAILEAWRIPTDMTTYEVCDKFVKPACRKESCGFLDVILKTKCPEEWFGPMNVFVSHWYVSL